jgi:hypothetical protein
MLERHGTGARAWLLIPEIRVTHTEITPDPYHDGQLMLSHGCAWAVYGILREKPSVGWIPEGVQIPLYGEREYDRKPGSPPAA